MKREVDVLVIGAGQAGLAMGFYLGRENLSYALVDAGERVGDVWRKRYDSLILFTPRGYSALPGMEFPGDQNGVPTKDEVADYLEAYAKRFSIPVHLQTRVHKLERTNQRFQASTNHGPYLAQQVIIATGPFQKPFIPKLQGLVPEEVFQIHSAVYRAPKDLKEGSVLVVGGGNTGVQLAIELSADREVYLALGEERKFLPLEFMTKNIFWWFDKLGVLDASIETKLGSWLSKQKDPIFGLGPKLKFLVNQGKIKLMPKLIGFDGKEAIFRGGERATISNILWATGFTNDYTWIEIPGVVDEKGKVIHQRGVSPIPGLYFLGLPWQYRRGSAQIGGVGRDARYLLQQIIEANHNKISLTKPSPDLLLKRIYSE